MKPTHTPFLTLTLLAALSVATVGCNRQETPAQTRADVSEAQQEGAQDVADERREARKDVDQSSAKTADASAEGRREVALAKASSEHKVAIERCEAMTGDARSTCKKKADAVYDRAESQAKMMDESAGSQY